MSEGHNPFLLDDETGFGSLPPPNNPPAAAVTGAAAAAPAPAPAPPRDPYSSTNNKHKRSASSTSNGGGGSGGGGSDEKPLLGGAGGSSSSSLQGAATVNIGGAVTSANITGGGAGGAGGDSARPAKKKATGWIFSASYYQQYFDVDTEDVVTRITQAVTNPAAGNFSATLDGNPDLYGPYWICATLIFLDAMGGNYALYLSKARSGADEDWSFDVKKISISCAMFYGYVVFVPVAAYFTLRCFGGVNTSLAGLICTYGYSLSVYVPVSLLCITPLEWMRWVFFLLGVATSTVFLFFNLKPLADTSAKGVAFTTPFTGCAVGTHALFGALLKLFFFQSF